jgi:hypothetical protein
LIPILCVQSGGLDNFCQYRKNIGKNMPALHFEVNLVTISSFAQTTPG